MATLLRVFGPGRTTTPMFASISGKGYLTKVTSRMLQASAENPSTLSFVMIFLNVNPNWVSHHKIFVRMTEEYQKILPTSSSATDNTPAEHESFPIFEQIGDYKSSSSFKFIGWHKITCFNTLPPYSKRLGKMLKRKWLLRKDKRS